MVLEPNQVLEPPHRGQARSVPPNDATPFLGAEEGSAKMTKLQPCFVLFSIIYLYWRACGHIDASFRSFLEEVQD